jgi:hypothetical protein
VSGWRIRWSSAGRAAAIGAAVLAAIAVLPTLLSADEPPPLPDDVGLAPAVEPQAALPPPPPDPAPVAPAPKERSKPAPERRRHPRHPRSRRPRDRRDGTGGEEAVTASPPAGSYTYTPGYSLANPSPEFSFER